MDLLAQGRVRLENTGLPFIGQTCLHVAAEFDSSPTLINALISAGADVSITDHCHELPLLCAIRHNNTLAAHTLLSHMSLSTPLLRHGSTPWWNSYDVAFTRAVHLGRRAILEQMLIRFPRTMPTISPECDYSFLHDACTNYINDISTAVRRDSSILELLLDSGVDPNASPCQTSPLQYVLGSMWADFVPPKLAEYSFETAVEAAAILVKAGARIPSISDEILSYTGSDLGLQEIVRAWRAKLMGSVPFNRTLGLLLNEAPTTTVARPPQSDPIISKDYTPPIRIQGFTVPFLRNASFSHLLYRPSRPMLLIKVHLFWCKHSELSGASKLSS